MILSHHPIVFQVVIAGRTVFKIYSIEEECFNETINLRSGKNINLNYSCNDVVWSNLVSVVSAISDFVVIRNF